MNFGDLQRNFGKSTVTFRLSDDTGHHSEVEYKLYEDFGNRSKSRQFCRRTTTHGGATTTRGGERQIKSQFNFPLFIIIYIFILVFIL